MKTVYATSSARNTYNAVEKSSSFTSKFKWFLLTAEATTTTAFVRNDLIFFASMLLVMRQKTVVFCLFLGFSRVCFFRTAFTCHVFCLFKWNFVFVHDRDVQLIDWLLIFKYYGISKHTQILCLLNWKTIFLFHLLFVNLRCIYHRGEADCRALPTKWLIVSLDCLFVGQFSLPYKISNVEIAAILSD